MRRTDAALRLSPMGAPSPQRWCVSRAVLVVAVALVSVITGACGDSEWRLAQLKTDPMADYALPAAIDTRATEFVGGTSGVSSPSTVRFTFRVPAGDAAAAIEEIASAAADAGWELREREPNGFTGDKKIDGMNAQIFIAGIVQDDIVWFELSSRAK